MIVDKFISIKHIDEKLWDSIYPYNSYYVSHYFSNLIEKSNIPGTKYQYLIFYENNIPIYKLALMKFEVKLFRFLPALVKKLLLNINFPISLLGKFNILTFQSLFFLNSCQLIDYSFLEKYENRFFLEINKIAKKYRAHLFLLLSNHLDKHFENLYIINGFYNSYLYIRRSWKSFECYLGAMRHKYRKNVKRKQKENVKNICKYKVLNNIDIDPVLFYKLYLNVLNKYSNEKEQYHLITLDFFNNLSYTYNPDVFFICVYNKNDKIIGYIYGTKNTINETVSLEFLGIDYDNILSSIYFDLYYYAIEVSIQMGMKIINLGIANLEAKLLSGAYGVPIDYYIHCISRVSKGAYYIYKKLISSSKIKRPNSKIKFYNVFKEDQKSYDISS